MTGTAAGPEFDVETAASRASAFVYGNILVLAALVALSPGVVTVIGVAYVLGTGLSTFIAHVVGEAVSDWIRDDTDPSWAHVRARVRNSTPIASSASIPEGLLAAARIGWLPATLACLPPRSSRSDGWRFWAR